MLRIRQIKIDVTKANIDNIKKEVARKLRININDINDLKINKESIDARKKPQISYIYEVDCSIKNEDYILKTNNSIDIFKTPNEEYTVNVTGTKEIINRPIVVGAGPAGLFAALNLARMGYKPLIIERGESIPERKKTVNLFWETNKLNPNSNIQFGEGGAGTFSDGKLNTMVKDPDHRCKEVFKTFVRCGADPKILYVNKPHIGTDVLEKVIVNLRNEIIRLGGEIRYNTCLTNIYTNNNEITKIGVNNDEIIDTNLIVLAIGHSARDTFYMLKDKLTMEPKPFAVGVRISHPQTMINKSQYGTEKHSILENADYIETTAVSGQKYYYGTVIELEAEDRDGYTFENMILIELFILFSLSRNVSSFNERIYCSFIRYFSQIFPFKCNRISFITFFKAGNFNPKSKFNLFFFIPSLKSIICDISNLSR